MEKLLFIALFVLVLLSVNTYAYDCVNVTDGAVDYWNYTGGDWNVSEGTNLTCTVITFNVTGNVSIYGNLTLSDVDFIFNTTGDDPHNITSYSGSIFNITNFTNISANNTDYEFFFVINSGTTFEMRNSYLSEVGYTGAGIGDHQKGLFIESNSITVENNTISSNYYGIILNRTTGQTIFNNTFLSMTKEPVRITYSNNTNVSYNNISSTGFHHGINAENSLHVIVEHNNITGAGKQVTNEGIRFYGTNNSIMNDNKITDYDWCLNLVGPTNNTSITDNNVYFCNSGIYILTINSSNVDIFNNTINTTFDNGIHLNNANNVSLQDNFIVNNSNNGIDIIGSSDSIVIKSNTIQSNGRTEAANKGGIDVSGATATNTIIANNTFDNNYYQGILDIGTNTIIANNTIENNTASSDLGLNTTNFGITLIGSDTFAYNNSISNVSTGILFYSTSNVNNATDNTINNDTGNVKYGILIYQDDYNNIYNNTIKNVTMHGIYFYDSDHNNVYNNTLLYSDNNGIYLEGANNTIENNTFESSGYYAVDIIATAGTNWIGFNKFTDDFVGIAKATTSMNYIYNNTIENTNIGLHIGQDNTIVENNTITNGGWGLHIVNENHSIKFNTIESPVYGIRLHDFDYNTIANNTVTNATYGMYCQLSSSSGNATIENNTFGNSTYNIYLYNVSDSIFAYNTIENSTNEGIWLQTIRNITFTNNTILRSGSYDFNLNRVIANITAYNMTFNDTTASFECINVSIKDEPNPPANTTGLLNLTLGSDGYLNITNNSADQWIYLNLSYNGSRTINNNRTRLFKYNGTDWSYIISSVNETNNYTYGNITSFSIFASLEEEIPAGTYCGGEYAGGDWNVTHTKDITCGDEYIPLTGDLTIYGNLTLNKTKLDLQLMGDGQYSINSYSGSNFTIDNQSNITSNDTDYEFAIIINSETGFVMNNSYLSECGWENVDNHRGLEIHANNSLVRNNTIKDSYTGIYLNATGSVEISQNTINTIEGYYGIEFHYSDNANISHNNISVIGANRRGMESFESEYFNIEYNNFTGDIAVCTLLRTTKTNHSTINDNYINGADWCIASYDSKNNTFTNNTVDSCNTGYEIIDSEDFKINESSIINSLNDKGIELLRSNDIIIEYNDIKYNTNNGIYLHSDEDNISIKYNTFEDNGDGANEGGIYIADLNCNDNIIANNTFNDNEYWGIGDVGTNTIIANNTIENNTASTDVSLTSTNYGIVFSGTNGYSYNNSIKNVSAGILFYTVAANSTDDLIINSTKFGIQLVTSSGTNITRTNITNSSSYDYNATTNSQATATDMIFNNTNASFEATDILIKNELNPQIAPVGSTSLNAYLNITNNDADAWAYLNLTYNYLLATTEPNAELLRYDSTDSRWESTSSSVNTTAHYVYSNISTFSIFGAFEDPPPERLNGLPSGTVTSSSTIMSLDTNENATCRYAPSTNIGYGLMDSATTTSWGTSHSWSLTSLANGDYNRYIKCNDTVGNYNGDDYPINFTVSLQQVDPGPGPIGGIGPIEDPTIIEEVVEEWGDEYNILPGGIGLLLDWGMVLNTYGTKAVVHNITEIDPSNYKLLLCNQTYIYAYEINITVDHAYLCFDKNATDLKTVSIYTFDEEWVEVDEIIEKDDKICGKIKSSPYMIAGFNIPATADRALDLINLAQEKINRAEGDTTKAQQLLEQARDAYFNCEYEDAYDLAQQAIGALQFTLIQIWTWILLGVVLFGGYYMYKHPKALKKFKSRKKKK